MISPALRAARFDSPHTPYGAAGICQQRGLDLFLGGIFDHVGGGFHRWAEQQQLGKLFPLG